MRPRRTPCTCIGGVARSGAGDGIAGNGAARGGATLCQCSPIATINIKRTCCRHGPDQFGRIRGCRDAEFYGFALGAVAQNINLIGCTSQRRICQRTRENNHGKHGNKMFYKTAQNSPLFFHNIIPHFLPYFKPTICAT